MLWLFIVFCSFASAFQGPSNRLSKFLLEQHEISAPPDGVIYVSHELELVHIVHVDELRQHMRVLVYVQEEWTDPTLKWDPAEFGGVNVTWLPEDKIWIPDIIVFNMLEHHELLHSVRSPIKVLHTGRVVFSYPAIYSVMCHIGVAKFPFDEQECDIRFASWGYPEGKLLISAAKRPALSHYAANEEWALQNVSIDSKHYDHEGVIVSEIRYVINISRKPFYYLMSVVLPTYIICMLSVSGLFARFSTKHERQERFTLGVTSILSMAVLSLVVTEKVPHSSEEVPSLIVYFHFNMVVVTVATILTSTVMRVHIKGFNHHLSPPAWMNDLLMIRRNASRIFRYIPDADTFEEMGENLLRRREIAEQWAEVSRRMDYLLMLIFLFAVSAPTVYLFYQWSNLDNTTPETRLIEELRTSSESSQAFTTM